MTKYMRRRHLHQPMGRNGMCYCEHCQRTSMTSPDWICRERSIRRIRRGRQYIVWHQQRLFELWRLWNNGIQAINPNASLHRQCGRRSDERTGHEDHGRTGAHALRRPPGKAGLMPPWANGKRAKEYRATMGRKAIAGIFSVGLEDRVPLERFRAERRRDPSLDCRWHRARTASDGLQSSMPSHWICAGFPFSRKCIKWHHANEEYFRNESRSRGLAWCTRSRQHVLWRDRKQPPRWRSLRLASTRHWSRRRIPFEMVHDRLLDCRPCEPIPHADFPEHSGALNGAV